MKNIFTLLSICILFPFAHAQMGMTPFEQTWKLETATYEEAISWYEKLAETYPEVQLQTKGTSDVGKPIHIVWISGQRIFSPEEAELADLPMLLINNAIHPGEPCGVDACMMLARDLLEVESLRPLLDKMVIGIIPVYNIGGALNRGSYSRANQEGPLSYGFRGNARNYDLNRDFIKSDTRNANAFTEIFHSWLPDIFVDTHTTNGADYQATLTLIPTRPEKLEPELAQYQRTQLIPALQAHMDASRYHMCPYVYSLSDVPDKGIAGFLDLPRYSSGYAALFQSLSFITEAHMLKPFEDRVEATREFLLGLISYTAEHGKEIHDQVKKARLAAAATDQQAVNWVLDREQKEDLLFKGFEYAYEESKISGKKRLKYDRNKPFEKVIPFYNSFQPTTVIEKPLAYILPQAYQDVLNKLSTNKVDIKYLDKDTSLTVDVYYIDKLRTRTRSYEGHFYHDTVTLKTERQTIPFFKGDAVIYTHQLRDPYLVHTLEPLAADAFFRWNAFDGILMQKEYFSSYVFEDRAVELLAEDPDLKKAFEEKKAQDSTFRESARAQLYYIYTHSPYYEKTHRRYPVFRWMDEAVLPLEEK